MCVFVCVCVCVRVCVCVCVCVCVFVFSTDKREGIGKGGRLSNHKPPSPLQFASANEAAGVAVLSRLVLVTEGI